MVKLNINIEDLFSKGLTVDEAYECFNETIGSVESEEYRLNLETLFEYAVATGGSLFIKIRVEETNSLLEMCELYLFQWFKKYVDDRENPALQRPLKVYGERDSALMQRVATNTGDDEETLEKYLFGHFVYMSAENMNGAILEEYLSEVLEPYGWYWCAGSIYRAVDFCYLSQDNIILLQVKNKYNTENRSSSAIRAGTEIKKWNRLKKPRVATGLDIPIPNWRALTELINADDILLELLTEENYLEYIRMNSTRYLDSL